MNTHIDTEFDAALRELARPDGLFARIVDGKVQIHEHGMALGCHAARCPYAGQPTGTMPPLQWSA